MARTTAIARGEPVTVCEPRRDLHDVDRAPDRWRVRIPAALGQGSVNGVHGGQVTVRSRPVGVRSAG